MGCELVSMPACELSSSQPHSKQGPSPGPVARVRGQAGVKRTHYHHRTQAAPNS